MMNTAIGTLIAVIVGAFVVQRMSSYPGIRSLSFILSSFVLTYGAVIIFFILTRLYYSRAQLVLSYVFVVALFFAVSVARRRMTPPRLLLLPFGAALRLLELGGVDWIVAQTEEQLVLPMEGNWPQTTPGVAENWQLREPAEPDLPRAVSAVVADLRADLPDHWERFIARCALDGIPVYHCKDISESITGSVEIEHLSENTFGSLLPNSAYLRAKSILDTIAAIVLLPSVVMVCAIAAIAIKLDDGGPVFFQQKRKGYRGQTFTMLKLRTMSVQQDPGLLFTLEADPRITRVGRFLRKYRIDELPQIVNVLRGEMSWIGPRPEALSLAERYGKRIPYYSYRHIVRPGMTGWAQVHQGNVAEVEAASGKLNYDFFYIKNLSPWLDLLISAKTLRIILTGFGSR